MPNLSFPGYGLDSFRMDGAWVENEGESGWT